MSDRFAERMKCVPRILAALNTKMGRPLDEHDLADLTQDTLLVVIKKLDQFAAHAPLESWVYRICALELMNEVRRKRRLQSRNRRITSERQPTAEMATDEFEHIHRALDRLGGHDADVVRLKHFEELTFEEIGDRLAISPNTAKTRYYRGISKLESYLGGEE